MSRAVHLHRTSPQRTGDVLAYARALPTCLFLKRCIFFILFCIIEESNQIKDCFWGVINGQSGERNYFGMLCLENLKTSRRLVGKQT